MDVYLKPSQHALNEVVIVGYGAHRKQELSGAVSIVAPSLQGRVAGVSVEGKSKQRMLYKPLYPGGYNSESYKSIKENGFLKPQNQPLSTFATDVDAASVISGALSTTGSYLLKKPFG